MKRSHAGSRSGDVAAVPRTRSPPSTGDPAPSVTTIRPLMPRWMPEDRPVATEVSHHMLLPRRRAAVSRRPTSASRISPGACGRQTQVSESSTSAISRSSAPASITARALSTSGSSGTAVRPGR